MRLENAILPSQVSLRENLNIYIRINLHIDNINKRVDVFLNNHRTEAEMR